MAASRAAQQAGCPDPGEAGPASALRSPAPRPLLSTPLLPGSCAGWGGHRLAQECIASRRARRPEAAAPCEARPAPVRSLQASSAAAMLARIEGILGPPPRWMLARGLAAGQYYSRDGRIFERNPRTVSCGTLSAALRCAVLCGVRVWCPCLLPCPSPDFGRAMTELGSSRQPGDPPGSCAMACDGLHPLHIN